MRIKNIYKITKTMNIKKAFRTYNDIRKVYGFVNSVKAINNKFNGRHLLDGIVNQFNNNIPTQSSIIPASVYDERGNDLFLKQQSDKRDNPKVLNLGIKFSIVIPLYNPEVKWLKIAVNSVLCQEYKNYELILVDDGSTNDEHFSYLDTLEKHHNIKIVRNKINGGISKATNTGIEHSTGDYICFMDQDDEITKDALYWFADALLEDPSIDWLYSDECKEFPKEKNTLYDFYFKPNFSLSLLLSHMFTGHLTAYKKNVLHQCGELRTKFDFSQDYDLALRMTKFTKNIKHIERVLYFWRSLPSSGASGGKDFARVSNGLAVDCFFKDRNVDGNVHLTPFCNYFRLNRKTNPLISIIIPSDSFGMIKRCITEILAHTSYRNYEIVVVCNTETLTKILDCFEYFHNIIPCYFDEPFNFSRKCNKGVEAANGDYIVLYNDDVYPVSLQWLESLLDKVEEPNVASVSPLCVDNNNNVQFAGMMSGVPGIITTSFNGNPAFASENSIFNHMLPRDISILSGACCLINKKIFLEVGGFDEINTPNGHSDVVLAFKFLKAGYRNVYNPFSVVKHVGNHSWHAKKKADKCDIYLFKHWGQYIEDPYFTHSQNACYSPYYNKTNFKYYNPKSIANVDSEKDILFVSHELSLSGAPIVLVSAVKEALKKGYFVVVMAHADGPLAKVYLEMGVPVLVDNCMVSFRDAFKRFAVNFDYVFVNTLALPESIIDLANQLPKVVWWLHEGTTALNVFGSRIKNNTPNNVSIFAVSDYTKRVVQKHSPLLKMDVVPCSVTALKKEKQHNSSTKVNFLVVGNFEKRKGQDILIQAFYQLPSEIQNQIHIIFIAKEITDKYQKCIQTVQNDKIHFTYLKQVNHEEMSGYYNKIDCCIVPSRDEPLSLIGAEAMSIGKPYIGSSRVGLNSYIIQKDKALIYKYDDAKALANVISHYVENIDTYRSYEDDRIKQFNNYFSSEVFSKNFERMIRTVDEKYSKKQENREPFVIKNQKVKKQKKYNDDLNDRINILKQGYENQKRLVVYLYDRNVENINTFRYRVYNIAQGLAFSEKYCASFFYQNEILNLINIIKYVNVIVLERIAITGDVMQVINIAKQNNVNIVFDIDDVIYDSSIIPSMLADFGFPESETNNWINVATRYSETGTRSNALITTTSFLANKMVLRFEKPTYVFPNTINLEYMKHVLSIKKTIDSKKFTIGYFSGSYTHKSDFDIVISPILEFMKKHKNVYLVLMGEINVPKQLKSVSNRIILKPLTDMFTLAQEIANVDVNIIPLKNTIFTNCKSELKYFEAAIVNTVTIASPTSVYKQIIVDGENGYLANTETEWIKKLELIYSSKNKCDDLVKKAYCFAVSNYFNICQSAKIEDIFDKIENGSNIDKVYHNSFDFSFSNKNINKKDIDDALEKWNLSIDKHCII